MTKAYNWLVTELPAFLEASDECEIDQDWDNEKTTFTFSDGSKITFNSVFVEIDGYMSIPGSKGGASKSEAKREAAKANGAKGGRPTKEEANALNNWDACVELMDDDLREQVHAELAPCTNIQFLRRYAELHQKQFGEEFVCVAKNGQW